MAVRILHPSSSATAGPLGRALDEARRANARRLARLFGDVGADDVQVISGPTDERSFGERLRELAREQADGSGLVVLGSGSMPLATQRDLGDFVTVAGAGERHARANSVYSADAVAIGQATNLAAVPDLPSDNALPRWLAEEAGYRVDDLRRRWRLGVDLDTPLDVVLARGELPEVDVGPVVEQMGRIRGVAADRRAELVVAGRTSGTTLRWLERSTVSRTRALVEERGLRAIGLASSSRPPRSVLGMVLDDRGPGAIGGVLAELGDGAIVDTRVLLAHRLGPDESGWPAAEDRYASDLLLADRIEDPWLRALTASARDSAIPVLLGGHTLVGPGIRLLLRNP